ncbi:MAG: hypothetical protein RSB50_06125 [Cetobacterium sp.]
MDLNAIKELGLGTFTLGVGVLLFRAMFQSIMQQNKESNEKLTMTTEKLLDANSQLVQTNREISLENRRAIEELTKEIRKISTK